MNKLGKWICLLSILLIWSCNKQWHLAEVDTDFVKMGNKKIQNDPAIDSLIAPYKNQIDKTMKAVIGEVAVDLRKRRPESNLGNWIADLLLEESQDMVDFPIDFAFQNYGGLRIPSISKGPLTTEKIFELMPFENYVVIMKGKGEPMKKLFDKMAEKGGWPISAGIQMNISDVEASDIMIHGEPFDMNKTYAFMCADYIANGGDNCDFLIDLERVEPGLLIRDVIIEHIKKQTKEGKQIKADITGRVKKI